MFDSQDQTFPNQENKNNNGTEIDLDCLLEGNFGKPTKRKEKNLKSEEHKLLDDRGRVKSEYLPKNVKKRDNSIREFDSNRIKTAVEKAMKSVNQLDTDLSKKITRDVSLKIIEKNYSCPSVDQIHTLVEDTLMDESVHEIAREYITYRNKHRPNLFNKRENIKPYEYPHFIDFVNAIRQSYWVHDEFDYSADEQDIRVNLSKKENSAVIRSMLAISQIESKVKNFWGNIYYHMPKPEIAKVGATFSESEVRHEDAYSNLIELVGMNNIFENIMNISVLKERSLFLEKVNRFKNSDDPKEFFETIILFSMFVENVSLFSQFLIIMSFNKKKNYLKGMSNAIEATSKEEEVHANFGFELVNKIKEENPKWWDQDIIDRVIKMAHEAFETEDKILDWIYENGDLDIIPKHYARNYIKERLNSSLNNIGINSVFLVDTEIKKETKWFDDSISLMRNYDFFHKRPTSYSKRQKAVTGKSIF